MEENTKKNVCVYVCIYINIKLNHFAVQQKLTQHCKSTILQFKKIKKKRVNRNLLIRISSKRKITGERGFSSQEREEGLKSVDRHFLAAYSLVP